MSQSNGLFPIRKGYSFTTLAHKNRRDPVNEIKTNDGDRRLFATGGEFLESQRGVNLIDDYNPCWNPWIQLLREPLIAHVHRLPVFLTKVASRPAQRKPSPAARLGGAAAIRLVWVKC